MKNKTVFIVGSKYTRKDIYQLLNIPKEKQRGDWLNGYHRHGSDYYIFCNIGVPGRTGHDYDNHWEGEKLVWRGKTKSHFGQNAIKNLISGDYRVLIFYRTEGRSPFVFAGVGQSVPVLSSAAPVQIDWLFKKDKHPVPVFENECEISHPRDKFPINKSPKRNDAITENINNERENLKEEFMNMVENIKTHKENGITAPYKPLFMLMLIERAMNEGTELVFFNKIEKKLAKLMVEFGPRGNNGESNLPFWHLKNDGFWEILNEESIKLGKNKKRPTLITLRTLDIAGKIPDKYWNLLVRNQDLRLRLIERLLNKYWEEDQFSSILAATGLNDIGFRHKMKKEKSTPKIENLPHIQHKQKKRGGNLMTVKLVDDARAILSMRESDFDAYSAYGEVIDNSIQAGATFSRIKTKAVSTRGGRGYKKIQEMAFGDDGSGMCSDVLHRCLQLGYSTRYNDRSGIGRFGVGMTLAAINQCQRVEVFSKEVSGEWMFTFIDLEEIQENGGASICEPVSRGVPEEYLDLVGENSGTLVIWKKYDRQPESYDKMQKEMQIWFGRTYRRFIWNEYRIILDGEKAWAIDPLYANWKNSRFPDDLPANVFKPINVNWPTKEGGDEESNIEIRMSLIHEGLRPIQGSGGTKEAKERYIDRNQGISIMRNDREVFYGPIPFWPGSGWFVEKDRWWGCEISFDAVLDRAFTVKNIKRGAVPNRSLKKTIYEQIQPTRQTCLEKVDDIWGKAKAEKRQSEGREEDSRSGHSTAESVAKKNPGQKSVRKNERGQDIVDDIIPGLSEEAKASRFAKWKSQPFTIVDGSWRGPGFFDVTHLGGSAVIKYNTSHPFITDLYGLVDVLCSEDEKNEEAFLLRNYIDLMTIAFAKAESLWEEDATVQAGELLESLEMSWGMYLSSYLKSFMKEYGGTE